MDRKLIVELAYQIKTTREEHKKLELKNKDNRVIFSKAEFADEINTNSNLKLNYRELAVLYAFVRNNPQLTDDELSKMLKKNRLKFLRECEKTIPDFFEELRVHGPSYIVIRMAEREELKVSRN